MRSVLALTAFYSLLSAIQVSAQAPAAQITGCHFHGSDFHCKDSNGVEGEVVPAPTNTASPPAQYTGCHNHGDKVYCMNGNDEVQFIAEGTEHGNEEDHDHDHEEGHNHDHEDEEGHDHDHEEGHDHEEDYDHDHEGKTSENGITCHFHAGVEHCVDAEGNSISQTCDFTDRDRNVGLRVGLLFAILAGTAAAVTFPVLLQKLANLSVEGLVFVVLKQFGTGVILSTALVHLLTHAQLLFANECVGELAYESTATAIVMAGVFLAFVFEYTFGRLLARRQKALASVTSELESNEEPTKSEAAPVRTLGGHDHHAPLINPQDKTSVWLIEAGIIFHSILIGLTLVVAGDSGLIVLFIVILFHQMFEGIALGARIGGLSTTPFAEKLIMCGTYALTTPLGMAIGLGVLSKFNGNDKSTVIALGTIDSVSAGILLWTGLVDMLAMDWIFGPLASTGWIKTVCSFASLVAGMAVMSLLGKWT